MPGVAEVQANGWMDDRSEGGRIQAKIMSGDVVAVPFRNGRFSTDAVGSGLGISLQEALFVNTQSSIGWGINFTVPANNFATGMGARIWVPFYGSIFGIQMQRQTTNPYDQISLGVDGEYYPLRGYDEMLVSRGITITDGDCYSVLCDDLIPSTHGRAHIGEIVVVSAPGAATARVYNLLLDRKAGYHQPGPFLTPVASAITNSPVAITKGTGDSQGLAVRKISYYNTGASARVVTIKYNGTVVWSTTLAAGASDDFDFGENTTIPTTFTHETDNAALDVNCLMWVSW